MQMLLLAAVSRPTLQLAAARLVGVTGVASKAAAASPAAVSRSKAAAASLVAV